MNIGVAVANTDRNISTMCEPFGKILGKSTIWFPYDGYHYVAMSYTFYFGDASRFEYGNGQPNMLPKIGRYLIKYQTGSDIRIDLEKKRRPRVTQYI